MKALELDAVSVYYGAVRGVEDVTMHVDEGEIVALLGANGAGKSTLLKAISGIIHPRQGTISYFGDVLAKQSAHRRVARGLVHVPEGRRIFTTLTIAENLELGAYGTQRSRTERAERLGEVLDLFPLLRQHFQRLAGTLSGGEQQVLAIGRAMMSNPKILMIDEPSLGLDPQKVDIVYDMLEEVSKLGTTVLLVEQNVSLALEIASRAYVLQQGSVVLSGPSSSLENDPRLSDAYLGKSSDVED
ncbi:MAG: ABC transporter ATP-binding protein [Acidimicrobiales bacterium]